MKRYAPQALVTIAVDDVRNLEDPTYFITEYGEYRGEFSRSELLAYLRGRPVEGLNERLSFPDRAEVMISVIHNYHGIKINPDTKEFRGNPVKVPDLEIRNPELARKRIGVVTQGLPVLRR